VVHVQEVADDAPAGDGQGDGAGRAGEDAQVDKAVVATDVTEAVAADVAEASHESEIPPQTDV
jgi:hypothetical protein